MDAFDADVLIYAAAPDHPLGTPIRSLLRQPEDVADEWSAGIGSAILLPELLSKPLRVGAEGEVGARHRLRAVDAVHFATAVWAGADRFITNNSSDFSTEVTEIPIVTP